MGSRKDKRRTARRRADQKMHAGRRRDQVRRMRTAFSDLSAVLEELRALAADDAVSPVAFAASLATASGSDGATGGLVRNEVLGWAQGKRIAENVDRERAGALALALHDEQEHPPELDWWTAGLYAGAGDIARAEAVATGAFERALHDPDDRGEVYLELGQILGDLRLELGRPADAAVLAFEMAEQAINSESVEELLATALEQVLEGAEAERNGDVRAETASTLHSCLARFADRTRNYELRAALADFVARDLGLSSWAEEFVKSQEEDFLAHAGAPCDPGRAFALEVALTDVGLDEAEARGLLWSELAWFSNPDDGGEPPEEDGDAEENGAQADGDRDLLLARFSRDPGTPPELAAGAQSWLDSARFGLWQLADPRPRPGVWLRDLVTGNLLYVAAPPEQLSAVPRWSVLAGCVVNDRGVWRTGGSLALLAPDEGDLAAALARWMTTRFVGALAAEKGMKKASRNLLDAPMPNNVPPLGVLAGLLEPLSPLTADLHSKVLAVAFADVLGEALAGRGRVPKLTNTDGEPLEQIRATGTTRDPKTLRQRLGRLADFSGDAGELERFVWRGRQMFPAEAEQSHAKLRGLARERGIEALGDLESPQHWIRGFVAVTDDGAVSVEVNSRARLDRLAAILRRFGVGDLLVESRVDPNLDLAVPPGWRPTLRAGSPEAEEAWLRTWPDEELPALGGRTPREAADDPEGAVLLESLLRRFEFDADLAASQGDRGVDVSQVRDALGNEGEPFSVYAFA